LCFYDWETGSLARKVEVEAREVFWSPTTNFVVISSEESFYLLEFNREALANAAPTDSEEGIEEAFELVCEINEKVRTGKWIGDCFVYTTHSGNKLNYLIGGKVSTVIHGDKEMYLLGYLPSQNRVIVSDKDFNIFSYALSLSVIEYQTAILRGDLDTAGDILPNLEREQRNRVGRWLESQEMRELALQVSQDPDHRFELALSLDDLDTSLEICKDSPMPGSESKWRSVGDKALNNWKVELAVECYKKAGDLSALLLCLTSLGNKEGLKELAEMADAKGQNNIAFACHLQLGDVKECTDILVKTDRLPEAGLFSRSFAPSQTSRVVKLWKEDLISSKKNKIADSLADPAVNPELFEEGWAEMLRIEEERANARMNGIVNGVESLSLEVNGSSSSEEPHVEA